MQDRLSSPPLSPSSAEQKRLANQESVNKDYEDRYTGDLPKYLGLPFQGFFIWLAARFPLLSDKASVSNKHNPSVDNADNFTTQAAGIVSGLFGYLIGKVLVAKELIKLPIEKPLNPSYRVFKTLSVITQMIGNIVLMPIIFIEKASQRLEMGFSAAVIGSMSALVTPFLMWVDIKDTEGLFKVAHEGWSKYVRTALYWGMCLGGCFAPFFLGQGSFNNLNTAVTYSGAVGGLVCCALASFCVPLINYFFKDKQNKPLLGFYTNKEEKKETYFSENNYYRDNYFRAGISICLGIGAAAFSMWGIMTGLPADELLGYAAWGGAICGAVGGVGFACIGRKISAWINRGDTNNPWDFILNNTGTLFGYAGITIGIIAGLIFFPGDPLSGMALGSCLGRAGGNLVGVGVGCCWTSAPEEEKTKAGYWTQRMLLYANSYGILGAFVGVGVGFGIYFLCPMFIPCSDLSLFTLLAASASIGTSAFAFIGGAYHSDIAKPETKLASDQPQFPGMNQKDINLSLSVPPPRPSSQNGNVHRSLPGSLRRSFRNEKGQTKQVRFLTEAPNGNGDVHPPIVGEQQSVPSCSL